MVKPKNENVLSLKEVSGRMVIVFRSFGMWASEESSIFYRIYGILLLSVFSILFTLSMLIQLVGFTNTSELTENSYMALTEFALSVKIINFYLRVRSMQSHLKIVQKFQLYSDDERAHFLKRLKFVFVLLMADFTLTNTAHLFIQIKTLLSSVKIFGFPAWFPFEWKENETNYWLGFAYQLVGMGITSNIQVVIQQYPSLMFCMVSTQMEILAMRLQNIGYQKAQTSHGVHFIKTSKEEINSKHHSEGHKENVSYSLKHCIKVHHDILE